MNDEEKAKHNDKFKAKEESISKIEVEKPELEPTFVVGLDAKKALAPASSEKAQRRISICRECPQFKLKSVCMVCKCFMPAKTKFESSKCPENKW